MGRAVGIDAALGDGLSRPHERLYQQPPAGLQGLWLAGRRTGLQPLRLGRGHQSAEQHDCGGLYGGHTRLRPAAGLRGLPEERTGMGGPPAGSWQGRHQGLPAPGLRAPRSCRGRGTLQLLGVPHDGV